MCNLYSVTTNQEAIRRLFSVETVRVGNLPRMPEIYPGQNAPVVRRDRDGRRELVMLRWGFVLPQQGRTPKDVTNARADKVSVSGFWRESFRERRCLVPVTRFCEWRDTPYPRTRRKEKVWFALNPDEQDGAEPPFAFAGLWRSWRGRYRDEPVAWDVFAFLTVAPNDLVRPVHAKAMPVMLTTADFDRWIDGGPDDALDLAKTFPVERMLCLDPEPPPDQPGLLL